ncbi:MAG: GWxTD domain-containing protein [Acidobacteria bacterium]|nr:GWxTD domain-containing protein [Acidobacteriota bacterium]
MPLAVIGVVFLMAAQPSSPADWSASAEAVFMTAGETRTWKTLRSDDERERFKAEYWLQRDTNPQTDANEFQELIRSRIEVADREFAIGDKHGSSTQRGRVFVLLGPAAGGRILAGPLDSSPKMESGRMVLPRGALDTREWHVWVYNREGNRELLETVGRRDFELTFIVDRGNRDHLESGPLFSRIREKVAAASLVRR